MDIKSGDYLSNKNYYPTKNIVNQKTMKKFPGEGIVFQSYDENFGN
jgi:hypothetical protein